jgi:hypothetical protein
LEILLIMLLFLVYHDLNQMHFLTQIFNFLIDSSISVVTIILIASLYYFKLIIIFNIEIKCIYFLKLII